MPSKNKEQNPPRRHHIIPRAYLKRFCDSQGRISGYNVKNGKTFLAKPADVAFEKDRNTQIINGEPNPRVEVSLNMVETPGAECMRDIDNGIFPFYDREKREIMSLYLALLYSRTDEARNRTKQAIAAMSRATAQMLTTEGLTAMLRTRYGREPTEKEINKAETARERICSIQAQEFEVDANTHIDAMLRETNNLFQFFANRNWRVFRFKTPVLATNDDPIVLVGDPKMRPEWGVGVGTARHIFFALDPHKCLVLSNTDVEEGIFDLSLEIPDVVQVCRDVNAANWRQASKFIFRHPDFYPLGQWKPPATKDRQDPE